MSEHARIRTSDRIVAALNHEYDEQAQHERAMSALRLVRDDIADGYTPTQRLLTIAVACACSACMDLDTLMELWRELGPWMTSPTAPEPSPVERFVAERCEVTQGSPSDATPVEFYEAYKRWAIENGESTASLSTVGLGRALAARLNIRSTPKAGVRVYHGLRLL